jgi:RNA polymerase sigma-70 factor (ECF subfamily)
MTSTHGFEDFVRSYQNMVYSTAVRILGNETDAQDIAQEVFLRAFKHYDTTLD